MNGEKNKMIAGDPYNHNSPELVADRAKASAWMNSYNLLTVSLEERHAMLSQLLADVGDGATVRPPFYCDYGYNISLGREVFLNFSCIILDVVKVVIGDLTQVGPGVQFLTPDHPRDPSERRSGLEFGRPIHIGSNVWIGGGALVMPGVTVGDDAIIGAGAVVTRDVATGVTVVGNPARPLLRKD
jgi:maltose O-acetyltransferase